MGQEESRPLDPNTPPQTLRSRTVEAIAELIGNGRVKRIVVLTGAGVSTSAGIPDFRSPDTGLYANLARLNLPYPEAVFDISFFRANPLPFYTLAHELHPARFRPTLAHSFIRLLSDKGLLLKLFTQNIDGLERKAGLPWDKIVNAHGSFARQSCIDCQTPFPDEAMQQMIEDMKVAYCLRPECGGLVKPDIVFFGEQLPAAFHENRSLPMTADLCIVMGTSLSVQPFASLPGFCGEGVPRLLINREQAGSLGTRPDDVLMLEDCDSGVYKLAAALGWSEELESLFRETNPRPASKDIDVESAPALSEHDALEREVHRLTSEIEQTLKTSQSHEIRVRGQLEGFKKSDSKLSVNPTDRAMNDNIARMSDLTMSEQVSDHEGKGLRHVFPHM